MAAASNNYNVYKEQWATFKGDTSQKGVANLEEAMGALTIEVSKDEIIQRLDSLGKNTLEGSVDARRQHCYQIQNICLCLFRDALTECLKGAKDFAEALKLREAFFNEYRVGKLELYIYEHSEMDASLGAVYHARVSTAGPNGKNDEKAAAYIKQVVLKKFEVIALFDVLGVARNVTELDLRPLGQFDEFEDDQLKGVLQSCYNLKSLNLTSRKRITRRGLEPGHTNLVFLFAEGTSITKNDATKEKFPSLTEVDNTEPKLRFYWEERYNRGNNLENLELSKYVSIDAGKEIYDQLKPYMEDFAQNPTRKKLEGLLALEKIGFSLVELMSFIAQGGRKAWSSDLKLGSDIGKLLANTHGYNLVSVVHTGKHTAFDRNVLRNIHFDSSKLRERLRDLNGAYTKETREDICTEITCFIEYCMKDNSFDLSSFLCFFNNMRLEIRNEMLPVIIAAALVYSGKNDAKEYPALLEEMHMKLPAYSIPAYFRYFGPKGSNSPANTLPSNISELEFVKKAERVKNIYPDHKLWQRPELQ